MSLRNLNDSIKYLLLLQIHRYNTCKEHAVNHWSDTRQVAYSLIMFQHHWIKTCYAFAWMFYCMELPLWKIIPVLVSGMQTWQTARMWTQGKNKISWSLVTLGKCSHEMLRLRFGDTNKNGSVCVWERGEESDCLSSPTVCKIFWEKHTERRRLSGPVGRPIHTHTHACIVSIGGSVSICVCENPPTPPPGVPANLVLRRELLHVGAETPEARQEVVDHHLLGNDCTGS